MKFNPNFEPANKNFPAALIAAKNKVFYNRRAMGLNVQFIRPDDGQLDEYSLRDEESRNAFVAQLERKGIDYVISE